MSKRKDKEIWSENIFGDISEEESNKYDNFHSRELIIIMCSIFDAALEEMISLRLLNDEKKIIDEFFDSECNSFSFKIKLAYLLGLIRLQEYETINIIRKMRNEFAHKVNVTFNSKTIQKLMIDLFKTSKSYNDLKLHGLEDQIILEEKALLSNYNNYFHAESMLRIILVDYQFCFFTRMKTIRKFEKCVSHYKVSELDPNE